ncbi:MAG: hypothetical protein GY849_03745, partial [Deltaproteobacteria bacterium]|nr:hypothetical protein [Deltaproteobacteria bacterium]
MEPGIAVYPRDARLAPLDKSISAGCLTRGSVSIKDRIRVFVPAGTFEEETTLTVTQIGEQSLPFPIPAGWTPISAVHVGPDNMATVKNIEISFFGPEFAEAALPVARLNTETHEWIRLESIKIQEKDGIIVSSPGTGTVVVIQPDLPGGPAMPAIGRAFSGSDLIPVPVEATVLVESTPKKIFLQAGKESTVRALMNTDEPLVSGTVIQVLFTESYILKNGDRIIPDFMIQDIVLYRRNKGLTAYFSTTPSCGLPELS